MSSLNKVLIMGNLTRDPEIKYTTKGTAVCDIGLAVNRKSKSDSGEVREEVTFIDVTLWGKTAEVIAKHMKKGGSVFVEGRLQLEQWDDKSTGQKRSKLKVIGENVQMIGRSFKSETEPDARSLPAPGTDLEEDDIPF